MVRTAHFHCWGSLVWGRGSWKLRGVDKNRSYKISVTRGVMYNMISMINTDVCYIRKLREYIPRVILITNKNVFSISLMLYLWLPMWFSGKECVCQGRRCGFDSWVRKIPWRRKWQPTPVFSPGTSHGQGSLRGYRPWGRKESQQRLNSNNNVDRWWMFTKLIVVTISWCL